MATDMDHICFGDVPSYKAPLSCKISPLAMIDYHMLVHVSSYSGWWFQPTPLKNHGVKVSWDDDIPNIWKNKNVPNHQPVYVGS